MRTSRTSFLVRVADCLHPLLEPMHGPVTAPQTLRKFTIFVDVKPKSYKAQVRFEVPQYGSALSRCSCF